LTFAEMMVFANDVYALGANLRVVPLGGWQRSMYFDATGLPWVPPSPNMPSLESAMHYPGMCLFEYTNLSVGRGTPFAFQIVGAPWLDAAAVLSRLANDADATVGVRLSETVFTPVAPTDGKFDGRLLRGIRLEVTNRDAHDPTRVAVALLAAVRDVHPDSLRFQEVPFDRLAAGSALREALSSGQTARSIWTGWQVALVQYRDRWAKYLLY
jgi:uncharacterized protein YbbC (DUF1343 family)